MIFNDVVIFGLQIKKGIVSGMCAHVSIYCCIILCEITVEIVKYAHNKFLSNIL